MSIWGRSNVRASNQETASTRRRQRTSRVVIGSITTGIISAGILTVTAGSAAAACASVNHLVNYAEGGGFYSSQWQYTPASPGCNDLNLSYLSNSGSIAGYWYTGSAWTQGSAGWRTFSSGNQSPWKILHSPNPDGTAYKLMMIQTGPTGTVRV